MFVLAAIFAALLGFVSSRVEDPVIAKDMGIIGWLILAFVLFVVGMNGWVEG